MNNILLVVIVLVLGFGGWYVFTMDNTDEAATMNESESNPTTSAEVDADMDMDDMNDMDMEAESSAEVDGAAVDMTDMEVGEEIVIDVKGTNYAFDVDEIRVKEGDTVTINFESADGFHDWVLDEFEAATAQVRPGTPTSVTFVAERAGTYEYYCSVGSHRAQGMVGKLIVE